MLTWIEARIWQITTGVFAALAVIVALQAWGLSMQNEVLVTKNERLQTNLDQCQRTSALRKSALDEQNRRITLLGEESQKKLAAAEQAVAQAQRENREARRRLNAFLAQPIVGDTVCERILDLDRRFVEEILQ